MLLRIKNLCRCLWIPVPSGWGPQLSQGEELESSTPNNHVIFVPYRNVSRSVRRPFYIAFQGHILNWRTVFAYERHISTWNLADKIQSITGGGQPSALLRGPSSMSVTSEIPNQFGFSLSLTQDHSPCKPQTIYFLWCSMWTTPTHNFREWIRFDLQELISVNPTESWGNGKQQFWHPEISDLHPTEQSVQLPISLLQSNYEPTLGQPDWSSGALKVA